ncbi:MAG: adenylate/guanylate cyclase domain-containing protein [Thaumarchaeota archaeon]|nr:adenylate/guanylate cyclase domain-containing protein [Nitrososphaerota archaeon]
MLKEKGSNKIQKIAEILGLLEEKGKGRDWLLEELKRHKIKLGVMPTNAYDILRASPNDFVLHISRLLQNDEFLIEDVRTLTSTYHWFFTDIVGSSDPSISTKEQARKILILTDLIRKSEIFRQSNPGSAVILTTGDGMVIGFSDSPEKPLRLAIETQKAISRYNQLRTTKEKLLIRVGIDTGPVYTIEDLNGSKTFWGPGIITARRVMDIGGPMQIFASSRIADDIRKLSPEYKAIMHPVGDYTVKHGEQLLIYNIYGNGFGNRNTPKKGKVQKSKAAEQDLKNSNTFYFSGIDLGIEITDPKTMMVRHRWTWDIKNISSESKDQIFYYLDGDAPRDFADMNVVVTDDKKKELEIISLNVNKPYHKEFIVRLDRPLKPNQKGQKITLQYDWEEPERNFFYKVSSDCKKLQYHFVMPKGIEVKNRVLKVDPETGYKTHASPAAKVRYLRDRTEITWQKSNLVAYEAYRFEW